MSDLIQKVSKSGITADNYIFYWQYQYRLGRDILVDYLMRLGAFKTGDTAVEIGSAEGGALAAFVERGASAALATDISASRLIEGEKIAKFNGHEIIFKEHNILTEPIPPEWLKSKNLAILRDVIEHLDDTQLALENIRKLLKPGGFLFVTFPPYHSPFGGHQHTVENIWGKIPYIHLLPDQVFHRLIASGRKNDIWEVKRLQTIRLTPEKFRKAALAAGYQIANEDYYLLRPVFKMKFGLPTVKMTALRHLPLVKTYFSLEAAFLLKSVE
jgi:SAM-dependent methyltransferase